MEFVTCYNRDLSPRGYLEGFKSLVWTERYWEAGDFEIVFPYGASSYRGLEVGMYIQIQGTDRLMRVDTVGTLKNDDAPEDILIKGPSVEKEMFINRIVIPRRDDRDYWTMSGDASNIVNRLVRRLCIDGEDYGRDAYQNLYAETPDPSFDQITTRIRPSDLYSVMVDLSRESKIGFRVNFDKPGRRLFFKVYRGSDRTTSQEFNVPVVFSRFLDNLRDASYIHTHVDHFNSVYVRTGDGQGMYVDDGSNLSGHNRRVRLLEASDVEEFSESVARQRGLEELAKHKCNHFFDGDASDATLYRYGGHYNMGDIVELDNEDGIRQKVRVVEYVRMVDQEGHREYPTFEMMR